MERDGHIVVYGWKNGVAAHLGCECSRQHQEQEGSYCRFHAEIAFFCAKKQDKYSLLAKKRRKTRAYKVLEKDLVSKKNLVCLANPAHSLHLPGKTKNKLSYVKQRTSNTTFQRLLHRFGDHLYDVRDSRGYA
jgi:hypothetical protein